MSLSSGIVEQIAGARRGDKRALGRLISKVENDPAAAVGILREVYAGSMSAWITGVTGAPGVGKSTMANLLIRSWRASGRRVAVLAVDPTSPFTGGALLGDRVRIHESEVDGAVLVRSMATRGWLGGLSQATARVATLCAGLGYDEILIETAGVGQSEVDIAAAADTTVVVVTPGWGDGIQVAKAGVMEIADVFVVNKADRDGAHDAAREITEMLSLVGGQAWSPPVLLTTATSGGGMEELQDVLALHRGASGGSTSAARLARRRTRDFRHALLGGVSRVAGSVAESEAGREALRRVQAGDTDPWTAAADLLEEMGTD